MARASKTGVKGLYKINGRFRIDLRYRDVEGRWHRYTEDLPRGISAAAAKERGRQVNNAACAGLLGIEAEKTPPKQLHDCLDLYVTWCKQNRPKTLRDRRHLVGLLKKHIADMPITHVSQLAIERFKRARADEGVKPATINRGVALWKHFIGRAVNWGGKIPWISIPDARENHGGVIRSTSGTITEAGLANSAARLLPTRTVGLCRTANSIGYVFILGRPMATSQDFVNWVCSEAIIPEFLAYALMAEGTDLRRFGRGSTHPTIYFPEVKALHICLPPVEEQREIVRRIVALLPVADSLSKAAGIAAERVAKLTQAVLAKAFRGELVPTEAELALAEGRDFETAEQLVARVKATTSIESTNKRRSPRRPPASAKPEPRLKRRA